MDINTLISKKGREPIACVTAYDYISAKLMDDAGMDLILVGDSLGMVVQGFDTTTQVSMDEMIYHARLVRRAVKNAFFVVDMPFGSCTTMEEGLKNAIRMVRETDADAVKIEGAHAVVLEIIEQLAYNGVNVVGHIGLQPQQVKLAGGYKIVGKHSCDMLLGQARALEKAGTRMLVIEGVDSTIGTCLSTELGIPTIGIGAGRWCDGQVLVFHDIMGYTADGFSPKFAKRYIELGELIKKAAGEYIHEVKKGTFPDEVHSYKKE